MINGSAVFLFRSGDYARDSADAYAASRGVRLERIAAGENETYFTELDAARIYESISSAANREAGWKQGDVAKLVHQRAQLHTFALFFAPLKKRDNKGMGDYVYDSPFEKRYTQDAAIQNIGSGSFGAAVKVPTFSENDVAVVKLLNAKWGQFTKPTTGLGFADRTPMKNWVLRSAGSEGGFFAYLKKAPRWQRPRRSDAPERETAVWQMHQAFLKNDAGGTGASFFDGALQPALEEAAMTQYAMPGTPSVHNVHSVIRAAPLQAAATFIHANQSITLEEVCRRLQEAEQGAVSFMAGTLRLLETARPPGREPKKGSELIDQTLLQIAAKIQENITRPYLLPSRRSKPRPWLEYLLNADQSTKNSISYLFGSFGPLTLDLFLNRRAKAVQPPGRDYLLNALFLYRTIYVPLFIAEAAILLKYYSADPIGLRETNIVQRDLDNLFENTSLMTGFVSLLFQGTFVVSAVADGGSLGQLSPRLATETYQVSFSSSSSIFGGGPERMPVPRNTKILFVAQMMACVHATSCAAVQHADISPGNVFVARLKRGSRAGARTRMAYVVREGGTSLFRDLQFWLDVPSGFYVPQLSDFGFAKDLLRLQNNRVFENTKLGTIPFQSPAYWMTLNVRDAAVGSSAYAAAVLKTMAMSTANDYWSMGWLVLRELMPGRSQDTEKMTPSIILGAFQRPAARSLTADFQTIVNKLTADPVFSYYQGQLNELLRRIPAVDTQLTLVQAGVHDLVAHWAVMEYNLRGGGALYSAAVQMRVYENRKMVQTGQDPVIFGGGVILKGINDFFATRPADLATLMKFVNQVFTDLSRRFAAAFARAVFDMFEVDPEKLRQYVNDGADRASTLFVHDHGTWIANKCLIPVLRALGDTTAPVPRVPDAYQVKSIPAPSSPAAGGDVVPHELPRSPFLGAAAKQRKTGSIAGDGVLPYVLPVDDPAVSQQPPYSTRDLTGAARRPGQAASAKRRRTGGVVVAAAAAGAAGVRLFARSRRVLCACA